MCGAVPGTNLGPGLHGLGQASLLKLRGPRHTVIFSSKRSPTSAWPVVFPEPQGLASFTGAGVQLLLYVAEKRDTCKRGEGPSPEELISLPACHTN